MGAWFSHLIWGDLDAINPVSGLSKRDIYKVQKSWALVYADPLGNGTELLKRFFRAYPKSLEFFKMIKHVPESEYGSNIQFKAHVLNLMSSLNQAVTNLNQPEVVVVMMNKLGESHRRRKIQESNFQDLKGVIVNMFIEVLKLDEATLGSWGKTVEFWYKHIFETLSKNEMTS
ncbi:globin [Colias croceus]|uniref:globin n=1 Tax=Colias crocea TaxID=72248 RepID=UPI001E280E9E|nr:globin [Colias croceus]XP_045497259.1 globin [Colias croceus]